MGRMHPDAPAPEPGHLPPPPPSLAGPAPHERRDADGAGEPEVCRGLIPQALLDPDAVFVVKRLQKNGHEAYLVGGCVRDLLAGLEPKDFDVATDAHPSRIRRLFHSARIIGRRFRLVHVRFPGDHVVETSTFRGDPERLAREAADHGESVEAYLEDVGENLFGTAPEDARRRDFTINALFYDPVRDEVVDWVGGLADLERHVVRSIGDPARRLAEDPVRMIRAVHFAQRLGFTLEPGLEAAIVDQAGRIADASGARLYVELLKIVGRGRARPTLHRLWELRVLGAWIPELGDFLDRPMTWPAEGGGTHEQASHGEPEDLPGAHATWNLLGAADRFGLAAHGAPESLALAVLFGSWLLETWRRSGGHGYPEFANLVEDAMRPVALRMSLPRWALARMRDVLWMLLDLRQPPGPRPKRRLFFRHGFAEALTLLSMDLQARDCGDALLTEWQAAAEEAGVETGVVPTDVARAETLETFPPQDRPRRARRGGRGQGRARTEHGEPRGITAEADAWEPPPESAAARAEPPPPPRPPPESPRHAPAPPAAAIPPAPTKRAPPPLLADDDFAAGLT